VGPNGRIRFDEHVEVGTRMAEAICRGLRFSNEDTGQIAALVANHLRFKDVSQMKPSTLKRFVRLDRFEEHLALHRLDCLSSHGSLDAYNFVQRFLAETPPEQVRPPRLLSGEDLKALGFAPGPPFKAIMEAVEEAQLNGKIQTREEAVELVLHSFVNK
jgi:poly(A) polymerase